MAIDSQSSERIYTDVLVYFVTQVFITSGFEPAKADQAAKVLVSADLRGIDSHGVARLGGYLRLIERKRIDPAAIGRLVHETLTTGTLDANGGLGLIVGGHAMDLAIAKAEIYGTGWIAVKNSSHFGIAAAHAMRALPHHMIGIAMTNASPLVAPTHSKERLLGTNPMCYAFPNLNGSPFVLDMATSAASNGKLEIAQRHGKKIPIGWAQNEEGQPTEHPDALKSGGAILPLGSDMEHGSYKGYGLGAVVDIFCGVLSGANYGPWVPPFVAFLDPLTHQVGEGIGHFFGALRVDGFRPLHEYQAQMEKWLGRFRTSTAVNPNEKVWIPGEKESNYEKERSKNGIPVHPLVSAELKEIARQRGLMLPFIG